MELDLLSHFFHIMRLILLAGTMKNVGVFFQWELYQTLKVHLGRKIYESNGLHKNHSGTHKIQNEEGRIYI